MSKALTTLSSSREIDAFLEHAQLPATRSRPARLLFALDATASREATWDHACALQAEMFSAIGELDRLAVQLCYYRAFREFHASPWVSDTLALAREMSAVHCLGGHTQIARVLRHALDESQQLPLQVLVLIGDCCEEALDPLCQLAGELGLRGTRIFAFHEGSDPTGARLFRQLAQLSGGAFAPFDIRSAARLKELLAAAAIYATGGLSALEKFSSGKSDNLLQLTHQLRNTR